MDIRYTAGLFDGEGGVRINKSKRVRNPTSHYTLVVYLQMTNRDIISNLVQDWGGTMRPYQKPKTNWKDQWVWSICGGRAITFLEALLPYSITKKPQIELALTFQPLLFSRGYNKKITEEQIKVREDCFQQMKHFNKRGK